MENGQKPNGISLRDYFQVKFDAQAEAIKVAREQLDYRLHSMNEFREQINKLEGTLITRTELEAKLDAIEKGKRDNIALIFSFIGIAIAIIGILIKI